MRVSVAKVLCVLVLGLAIGGWVGWSIARAMYSPHRYEIQRAVRSVGDMHIEGAYGIDHETGDVFHSHAGRRFRYLGRLHTPKTCRERAIELAKSARTLSPYGNEWKIRSVLEDINGEIQIQGWSAEEVDKDNYIVRFVADDGEEGELKKWQFHVNVPNGIVRRKLGGALELLRDNANETNP